MLTNDYVQLHTTTSPQLLELTKLVLLFRCDVEAATSSSRHTASYTSFPAPALPGPNEEGQPSAYAASKPTRSPRANAATHQGTVFHPICTEPRPVEYPVRSKHDFRWPDVFSIKPIRLSSVTVVHVAVACVLYTIFLTSGRSSPFLRLHVPLEHLSIPLH